jgi:DNA-binding NtrC family response regulator
MSSLSNVDSKLPEIAVPELPDSDSQKEPIPLSAMVRAVCQAAQAGPDLLYEVMLKLSLMVEGMVPTYGLSIWSLETGQKPTLNWAEGLQEDELAGAEAVVTDALTVGPRAADFKEGDHAICFVLAMPHVGRPGAALYGLCAKPLTKGQARDLQAIVDVAKLAHVAAEKSEKVVNTQFQAVTTSTLPGMVFSSKAMSEVARAVERIKDSESAVLITGESGTGKELIARAIHRLSKRNANAFVPFNCSAAPAELIESMLFGHRRGTFTGALNDSTGLIRAAEDGTLFLDEIGDLPLMLQPKLLRFLQEGEIHTLGEHVPRKVNVRVVAATHKDLEQLVREKLFREDLYYRIATLNIQVPPLRERMEDVSALISHFVTHYARRNDRAIAGITWEAIRILEAYSWPGNIRELAAEIERLVLYTDENGHITPEHLSKHIAPRTGAGSPSTGAANLENMLEDYERRVITETLKRHDCNVARASEALGLGSRQTLYKKLKRLAIDIGDFLQEDTEPGLQLRSERN